MTRALLRSLLALAVLYVQLPCGSWGHAAPPRTTVTVSPTAKKGCRCCHQMPPAEPAEPSDPAPPDQSPPADCPCALCSAGFVPLAADEPASADEPTGERPVVVDPPRGDAGHHPLPDRPPRTV